MALVSPGVEVQIVDQSNYLPSSLNSVPYILIATAQNKISGNGQNVAPGTLASNVNKTYLITSQRDLANTFGNPFFYKTTAGSAINGYELNEYGLMAAYSVLGSSNRAYIQRVNVDLSELVASLNRPTGVPANGTFWLDTTSSTWGIFQWDAVNNSFTNVIPTVITSATQLITPSNTGSAPLTSVGNQGDYAVVTVNANNPVYYKSFGNSVSTPAVPSNTWVHVGSAAWQNSFPTIQARTSITNLSGHSGEYITINGSSITVPGTLTDLASAINGASIAGVCARVVNNKLQIFGTSTSTSGSNTGVISIADVDSGTTLTALGITAGDFQVPALQISPHYNVPKWRHATTANPIADPHPRPSGSVWVKTTAVNQGANLVVKKYSSTSATFITQNCPLYADDQSANASLDPGGGGLNIAVGATYAQTDVNGDNTLTYKIFERMTGGTTVALGSYTEPTFSNNDSFYIQASVKNSFELSAPVEAVINGTTMADWVAAFTSAGVENVTAQVTSSGQIQITHTQGGVIVLTDHIGQPIEHVGLDDAASYQTATGSGWIFSGWELLPYTASLTAPNQNPLDGRKWYYSSTHDVDLLINSNGTWRGYRNVTADSRGFNLSATDPAGPIITTQAPTKRSDGAAPVYGDIWIDSSDLENYPIIHRWERVDGVDQWRLIDNKDTTTHDGIIFADARWDGNANGTGGDTDPVTDASPTIEKLLLSDYTDLDAPDAALYPAGTLLWNTRRSGYNVKQFKTDYFTSAKFPGVSLPAVKSTWVTVSGNKSDNTPYMGRKAVRSIVVAAMKSGIDSNTDAREEQRQFNIIAAPGYPELIPNMVALNNDRNNTAFVIGDAPLRLSDDANAILNWTTNAYGAGTDSEDGLVTGDPYLGVFYPSCQTTDLGGSSIVQPASHMIMRTMIRNDNVAYPWLAPAGTRRGLVDNASALGYINAQTGAFVQTAVRQSLRDTLYANKVNPITYLPGVGITNYGNKTLAAEPSALDRINVSRLIAYIRGRLDIIGKAFVFEPNDQSTRDQIKGTIQSLMNDLVAKRGIYDYLVVCDASNNTPTTIDQNELYVDIAIEPVKSVEFIYIPVRIKNTGQITSGQVASASPV